MINENLDPVALHEQYKDAKPFPHLIIDDFLVEASDISATLEETDLSNWSYDPNVSQFQVNKFWNSDLNHLPENVAMALWELNQQLALDFFSELTGIPNLIADPSYLGGGVHVTMTGGKLDIHADFNIHPETGLHRRVNALLFLNEGWRPEWNGQLELYDKDNLARPAKTVDPILNRLAVFGTTDTSFHGVPEPLACPPNRKRFSLALYYYTEDRPDEEKSPFHWASWQTKG